MAAQDGVIQYVGIRRHGLPDWTPALQTLNQARTRLFDCGLIGAYPDGVGYGNLSLRVSEDRFVVTGSATGNERVLRPDQYCLVERFSLDDNRVWTIGHIDASSECMTHGAIYAARPDIRCVIHVHSRRMFDRLLEQGAPSTPSDVPYGTPTMAYAVQSIARAHNPPPALLVMAGHDEGLVSFGTTVDSALTLLLEVFNTLEMRS